MTTSKSSPFLRSPSAQARTLFRLARSSATRSKLPPLASACFRTCAVAASAFAKSRAAPTTCAPCAARDRAVSTPSPAETPVTKIRFPRRVTPARTSSVVDVAPNTLFVDIASRTFAILFSFISATDRVRREPRTLFLRGLLIFKIVGGCEIGDQPRLLWLPFQQGTRLRTGSRAVHSKEQPNPAKMVGCFLARLGDDGHVQLSADYIGDVSSRHAFVGDPVITRSSGTFSQSKPVEVRCIEPV